MSRYMVVTCAVLLAPALCQSADPSFYLGGSIGQGVEINAAGDVAGKPDAPSVTLFGGIEIGEHLAAEVGYHDFRTTRCLGERQADIGFERNADGFSASAVALWQIDRFRLFVEVGALFWNVDGHDVTIAGLRPYSNNGVGLITGLGGDLAVAGGLRARLVWEHLEIDGNDADSVSIGVLWRF